MHITLFTNEIQKSLKHDTSAGIIGDFSTGRASLKSNFQIFNVNGIDSLSMPITSGKVEKSTIDKRYELLSKPSNSIIANSQNMSSKINKSLTYSGHKLQGRTKLYGMDISIENKKGSYRSGVDSDGHNLYEEVLKQSK